MTLYLLLLGAALFVLALSGARKRRVAMVAGVIVGAIAIEGLATLVWSLGPMAAMSFMPIDVPFAGG